MWYIIVYVTYNTVYYSIVYWLQEISTAYSNELDPTAVLLEPVELFFSDAAPIAVLWTPVISNLIYHITFHI